MTKKFLFVLLPLTLLLAGCSTMWDWSGGHRNGTSSSLVDYLYPDGEVPPDVQDTIPYLELPLRVGVAFVPGQAGPGTISEASKMQLLEEVKASFVDREYIGHIEVIPDTYLRSSKGITGMQQVARVYGVDVMALVSYDQVAVSEENPSGFLYWTIVGSYFIKATSNEVQTFVDTAVFDVDTARLLFRAPGTHTMSDRSTLVEAGEVVRKAKDESFAVAMDTMTGNLAVELDGFRERVQDDPTVAEVKWKEGSGGGSMSWLLLGTLAAWRLLHRGLRRRTGWRRRVPAAACRRRRGPAAGRQRHAG